MNDKIAVWWAQSTVSLTEKAGRKKKKENRVVKRRGVFDISFYWEEKENKEKQSDLKFHRLREVTPTLNNKKNQKYKKNVSKNKRECYINDKSQKSVILK
ncbi:uncharacterized protein VTP21DRAFT_6606 [Calcarisporiella thermophila]|uniref:uncharacterized protein n=1 Tax=Calcarisporiella thermophila TaxID=911321 RepID=UPI003741EA61